MGVTWDGCSRLVIVLFCIEALQGGLSEIAICQRDAPCRDHKFNKSVYLMSIRRNGAKVRDKRYSRLRLKNRLKSGVLVVEGDSRHNGAVAVCSVHCGRCFPGG